VEKDIEILIVEDSPTQAMQLKRILERNLYRVSVANNGKEALALITRHRPTLIISDIIMPEKDGYDLCCEIKENDKLKDIPVILVTTLSNPKSVIRGLECGADNFIMKPYDEKYLLSRIRYILSGNELQKREKLDKGVEVFFAGQKYLITSGRHQILNFFFSVYEVAVQKNLELNKTQKELRNFNEQLEQKIEERTAKLKAEVVERKRAEEALKQSYERLQKNFECMVKTLSAIAEKRDPYTAGHQRRVAQLACAMAREMGLSEPRIQGIHMAGLLHDIGKIAVPIEILSKPGPIGPFEFGIIKTHPKVGYEILKEIEFPWPVADIVHQHHERMDGSGYPRGLLGSEIVFEARIMGVADVVEAMSSHRPFRPALGIGSAMEEISKNRGINYDPEVVDVCLKLFTDKKFEFEISDDISI